MQVIYLVQKTGVGKVKFAPGDEIARDGSNGREFEGVVDGNWVLGIGYKVLGKAVVGGYPEHVVFFALSGESAVDGEINTGINADNCAGLDDQS